jgi:type IV fimbrial biogenesis protein FimT
MRGQRGVTLLELMIVVLLLGIVLSLGVPGFRELVLNNRQAGAVNEFITALQLARSEAITSNVAAPAAVSVCPSNNGTGCAGNWSDGWIVFTDANADGNLAGDDRILRAVEAPQGIDITGPGWIGFRRDGRVLAGADFEFCDARGSAKARVVQVGISGRPAASKVLSGGGSPECD